VIWAPSYSVECVLYTTRWRISIGETYWLRVVV
jgi:hypothetical protein